MRPYAKRGSCPEKAPMMIGQVRRFGYDPSALPVQIATIGGAVMLSPALDESEKKAAR